MSIVFENDSGRKGSENEKNTKNNKLLYKSDLSIPVAWSHAIPGEELTSKKHVYEASQKLIKARLSIIPIDAYEGTKSPDSLRLPHPHDPFSGQTRPSWSIYQLRQPTQEELECWYDWEGAYGLAVVGGTVSGGQEGYQGQRELWAIQAI